MRKTILGLAIALTLVLVPADAASARGGGARGGRGGGGRGTGPAPRNGGSSNAGSTQRPSNGRTKKDQARLRERAQMELREVILVDAEADHR